MKYRDLRSLYPRKTRDKASLLLLLVGVPFSVYWMWNFVLPFNQRLLTEGDGDQGFWFLIKHLLIVVFLFYNVAGNLLMVLRVDPSGRNIDQLPAVLKPGWHFCHECEVNSPPRSYHCPHCRTCIYRRDHHCTFTGCCIGLYNQRFFFIGVLYLLIGLTYGLTYQFQFTLTVIPASYYMYPVILIAPHFCLMLGYINTWQMVVATLHGFALSVWCLAVYVVVTQALVTFTGITQYERRHNMHHYNIGLLHNIKMTLGERWYLVLLSPFIKSPIPCDGLTYTTKDTFEEPKSV